MASGQRQAALELTIGVVGSADLVERIMLTAQDAEAHARAALARSHDLGARGFAFDRDGHALVPGPREPVLARAGNPRGMATLSRLSDKLPETGGPHVVDAETAGRLLGVTARTARRLLRSLAEEGLAWPLPVPAAVSAGGGTPWPRRGRRRRLRASPSRCARPRPRTPGC